MNANKIMMILAGIGLLVSIYLTIYHYLPIPLACPDQGVIDCGAVLNGPYAVIFGIPVAFLGVIFFAVEFFLLMKVKNPEMLLLWNGVGIASIMYFIYTEYLIGHICIYCTTVHIMVLGLFIMSFYEFNKK